MTLGCMLFAAAVLLAVSAGVRFPALINLLTAGCGGFSLSAGRTEAQAARKHHQKMQAQRTGLRHELARGNWRNN